MRNKKIIELFTSLTRIREIEYFADRVTRDVGTIAFEVLDKSINIILIPFV